MNKKASIAGHRSGLIVLPLLYTLAAGMPAVADDTEILTGQTLPFAAPNIMFIIDTSGSMDAQVLVDDSFDPLVAYSGPFTDASRSFFTIVDRNGQFVYPGIGYENSGNFVNTSSLVCVAANVPLTTTGTYTDFIAQFDATAGAGVWSFLSPFDADPLVDGSSRTTECLGDDGIHGLSFGDPAVYPVNGELIPPNTTPYASDAADPNRVDWFGANNQYIFFSNNYLNWLISSLSTPDPVVKSRLRIVQDVTNNLIDRITINNQDPDQVFNVGLMRFSTTTDGGMVLQEVGDIGANAQDLRDAVDSLTASSSTPLTETVFEAYQYFRGAPVGFGVDSLPVPSTPDSQSGGNYLSPLQASCQKNYIVLLTDGLPSSDVSADAAVEALAGTCVGNCLDELTSYMDQADFSTLGQTQTVQTFTIGFFTDSTLLQDAATGQVFFDMDGNLLDPPRAGNFTADDVDELQVAFDSILDSIESDIATFTSPAVSVNSLNRLTNRNVLYFTMFVPPATGEPHWDGNLKAYFIGRPSNDPDAEISIIDADGRIATDENGIFDPAARSLWSQSSDGGVVTEGGVAASLSNQRTVVSNIVGGSLFGADNRVIESNALITATDLNIANGDPVALEAERQAILKFARGLNEDDSVRNVVGDPLHSQPLVLTYAGAGGDDLALFFTTNDGYFHHIDPTPSNGPARDLEQFAFIPRELLRNLDEIKRNPPALPGDFDKVYGLDGSLTAFIKGDENFVIDSDEQLFVNFGMRRGGNSYYSLDFGVGGRSDPRLAWKISRGDSGFAKLGQTWSSATPAQIKVNGSAVDVLIFAGGYATAQDAGNGPNEGTGNAIYIVEADTATLLWSASSSGADLNLAEMVYAIPSDIAVLDIDQDGFTDRLYVGDMGAQVFRFDIDNSATGGGTPAITGAVFADLGGAGASDERRFFNQPSIARIATDEQSFLSVSVGSGYRAHPLDTTVSDRFYVLKDVNVFTPPVDAGVITYPPPLTSTDLLEIGVTTSPSPEDLAGSGGWFIELDAGSGEKNLASALTVNNQVFFSTYSPESTTLSCQPTSSVGTGRLYAIDILTGLPTLFLDINGNPVEFTELQRTGIPPAPTLVFTEPPCTENCGPGDPGPDPDEDPAAIPHGGLGCDGAASEVTMFLATEAFNPGICTAPVRTYWYERDVDNDDN